LNTLIDMGLVQKKGQGRSQTYLYNSKHPLASLIDELFAAEASLWHVLLNRLKTVFSKTTLAATSVWIEGDVASSADTPASEIILCFLAADRDLNRIENTVLPEISKLEAERGSDIALRPVSRADLRVEASRGQESPRFLIFGVDPHDLVESKGAGKKKLPSTHAGHDQRSLELGRRVAIRLKQDPSAIDMALAFIEQRAKVATASENKTLAEWQRLLMNATPAQICRLLQDPGERGTRLRQSLPFVGIFDEKNGPPPRS